MADSPEPSIRIPAPSQGATFQYEEVYQPGEDPRQANEAITVQVASVAQRLDNALIPREVVRLDVTFWKPYDGGVAGNDVEESVDPTTGTVVQHLASCSVRTQHYDGSCPQNTSLAVFGPDGVPGGLGLAPFWGDRIPIEGSAEVQLRTQRGLHTAAYNVSRVPHDLESLIGERPCIEITATDIESPPDKILPFTVTNGPLVVCDGLALPVSFETAAGDVYRLTGLDTGGARLDISVSDPSLWVREPAVPLRPWTPPILGMDGTANLSFPVDQAHSYALEHVPRYARLFEENEGALLAGSSHRRAGTAENPVTASERFERILWAADPDGEGLAVTLEKKTTTSRLPPAESRLQNDEAIHVTSVEQRNWDPWPLENSTVSKQADPGSAIMVGEELTGAHHFREDVKMEVSYHAVPWRASVEMPDRSGGYTIVSSHKGPNLSSKGGFSRIMLLRSVVDGPTGLLEWAEVWGDQVPLIENVEPRG